MLPVHPDGTGKMFAAAGTGFAKSEESRVSSDHQYTKTLY